MFRLDASPHPGTDCACITIVAFVLEILSMLPYRRSAWFHGVLLEKALLLLVTLLCFGCGRTPNAQRQLYERLSRLEAEKGWHILVNQGEDTSYLSISQHKLVPLYARAGNRDFDWIGAASLKPDGTKLAFAASARGESSSSLVVFDLKGRRQEAVLRMPYVFGPRWSPSGNRIAFIGQMNDGGSLGLYVYDLGKKQSSRVVSAELSSGDGGFAWAPGDRAIVYLTKSMEIRTIDLETRQTQVVGRGYSPSWSPDGKYIAYVSEDQKAWVFKDSRTGREERAPTGKDVGGEMVWSPDGQFVAYCSYNEGFWSRLGDVLSQMDRCGDLQVMDVKSKLSVKVLGAGYSTPPADWSVIQQ